MEAGCGWCRWCGEAVSARQARYVSQNGTSVHDECMEDYLLQTVGLAALADAVGFEYRWEEDVDAE